MTNNNPPLDPAYLDTEEQSIMDSLHHAIDAGEFAPSDQNSLEQKKAAWQQRIENAEKRKAITLRLQNRDIDRLKVMARKKGLPYQTFIASSLHQLANGDLVQR